MFIRPIQDWIAVAIVTVCAIAILSSCDAHAETITNERAVKAIMGEARGEGYTGMYAVACAIRNRGSLNGVYGVNVDTWRETHETWRETHETWRETHETWQKALNAWENSATGPDVTHGATHWESVDFKTPYWAKSMVQTAQIGKHKFYKEKS